MTPWCYESCRVVKTLPLREAPRVQVLMDASWKIAFLIDLPRLRDVAQAVAFDERDLAVLDDGDGRSRHTIFRERSRDERIEVGKPGGRRPLCADRDGKTEHEEQHDQ